MSPLISSNESVASVSLAPIGGYQIQVLPMTINYFVWATVQVLIIYISNTGCPRNLQFPFRAIFQTIPPLSKAKPIPQFTMV